MSWLRDRWWSWRIKRKIRKAWKTSIVRLDPNLPGMVAGFPKPGAEPAGTVIEPVGIDVFVSDFGGPLGTQEALRRGEASPLSDNGDEPVR